MCSLQWYQKLILPIMSLVPWLWECITFNLKAFACCIFRAHCIKFSCDITHYTLLRIPDSYTLLSLIPWLHGYSFSDTGMELPLYSGRNWHRETSIISRLPHMGCSSLQNHGAHLPMKHRLSSVQTRKEK